MGGAAQRAQFQRQVLQGAYIELEQLMAARLGAQQLRLSQRRRALSLLAGPNKTNFRGRGIEFEEVRHYQPGDDVRAIDWRVTARQGRPYTKLFHEERERPATIVVDQRQAMFFGSQTCFKSVSASYLAALLGWACLQQGDRVGGLIIADQALQEIRPQRSQHSLLRLLRQIHHSNQQLSRTQPAARAADLAVEQMLGELRRISKPGHAIFLISDFNGFDSEAAQKQLSLLARHCEITALFVYDPMERELPPPGQYLISNGQARQLIDTAASDLRQRFADAFAQRRGALSQQLGRLGIPLIAISTAEAPLQRLLHYYGNQRR